MRVLALLALLALAACGADGEPVRPGTAEAVPLPPSEAPLGTGL